MDKAAIKNFATAARAKFREAVMQKAFDIGVFENEATPVTEVQGGYVYNGVTYSRQQFLQRSKLVEAIELHAKDNEKGYSYGYDQVIEEVAYTWFNRLIALRFMEINGYLPSSVRILSSKNENRVEPDCIRDVESLDFVDMQIVSKLSSSTEKLYKYILIAQCNSLADIMPKMFEKIADYSELLLPNKLYLQEGDIVFDLVHSIKSDDFKEHIEIIGWLYQFYNENRKNEIFAGLKSNIKITKENIPAATQLFTPSWIVKYMVENSLGRLAVEKFDINPIEMGWKYYLKDAKQTDEVKIQLATINIDKGNFDIKEVKVIDPCMGSGHILVYAFDVLYQIYEKIGYNVRDIPTLILENNLYGLDIDGRAGQLTYFALIMKARNHNHRFFRQNNTPQPKVYAMIESDSINMTDFTNLDAKSYSDIEYLINLFADSSEYGSILEVDRDIDFNKLIKTIEDNQLSNQVSINNIGSDRKKSALIQIIEIAELLNQKYDIIVTNPPYMGNRGMGSKLSEYVKKHFPASKSDLFAVFIEKCGEMLKPNGLQAMITQHAFMFLASYEKLREKLIKKDIVNMAHLGARAFEEIGGEVVQTTIFVYRNSDIKDYKSSFVRLVNYNSQSAKEQAFLSGKNRYTAQKESFAKIPGISMAYWVSEKALENFEKNKTLGENAYPKTGMTTGDNNKFLRMWYEVWYYLCKFDCESGEQSINSKLKWFPYCKGGGFRRWYGYNEYLVNWENNGYKIKNNTKTNGLKAASVRSESLYFKKLITWSAVASGNFSCRLVEKGFLFDSSGSSISIDKNDKYILGLLNSIVGQYYLDISNSTLSYLAGDISKLPIIISNQHGPHIEALVAENIAISKRDWDSFETSWDFERHPLASGNSIQSAFEKWEKFKQQQFTTLKSNEEELNRIFIEIYNLQGELKLEVEEKNVTIRKADFGRDVRGFVSYAVGCMLGRYSLDVDGIAYAGGSFDKDKYVTFVPDDDNVIPITHNNYFDDDIVVRFVEFVSKVYGNETIDENLDFIANALYPGSDGKTGDLIRRYFTNDFYKDHVKMYQKKPIYWQFESGNQGGFKALIYLHRYDKYNVLRIRADYLHVLQRKYDAEIKQDELLISMTKGVGEIAAYKKQIEILSKKSGECRAYDPAIAHIANLKIELELDDGVSVNYSKFQGIEVLQSGGKGTVMIDVLSKI